MIVPIVEGDGETTAAPLLLRRLLWENQQRFDVRIARARNAHGRSNLTKIDGLEKFLERIRREPADAVLVLLDADQDCAKELAEDLAARTRVLGLPFPVAIVCAKCEYEAWFLASLETIMGISYEDDVEAKRGVKEWLSAQMLPDSVYQETKDQAAMTQQIDFTLARERSRSFRRLEHAIEELLDAIDGQKARITP